MPSGARRRQGTAGLAASVLAGALAGIVSYWTIAPLQSPWSEVIGALLVGLVPGLAKRSLPSAATGSVACAAGWLTGALLFGIWMDLGIGAWLLAGAFLGAAGTFRSSGVRVALGAALGLLGGAVGEASRYATVLVERFRSVDMQLILLLSVGMLLNAAVALVKPRAGERPL